MTSDSIDIINAFALLTNFVILPALSYGSQLALGALAVTLVYSVLRFSNFAQGDSMAFGTMIVILLTGFMISRGWTISGIPTALLVIPIAIVFTSMYLLTMDRLIYRHYRKIKAKSITIVMSSIGVMFVTGGIVRFVLGATAQKFEDGERFIFSVREFKAYTGLEQGIAFKTSQFLTITIAFLLVAFVFYFLQKTKTGKAMRAYSDNKELALLSGIDPDKMVQITWLIVAALTTIAGALYGLDKGFAPQQYHLLLLPIFASVIVGGIGSPIGAIAGAFLVAFSEILLTYAYKKFLIYLLPLSMHPSSLVQLIGTEYKYAISFVILVIVLLIKPTGLFKGKVIVDE
ncbi:branched-chain amino acid ABC transporter permease [Candidatus Pseudothioglobus sp. Uisw_041]|jgi:branched-subunit amino acid ABC-type transport system permease component|uniref:branched-chain amino acid ABC transporter permease n=1 Tax=unclassified Candidatus Pseudothioglobus TaxID=3072908 RepID=UPI00233A595D|nr:branched-chain amino acid ABC transporter permease [Candidatus Thioglobus sp.]MDB4038107.1 branched-chain amino acid ABC transporter permease [Candidatus Thioglobus sp.]MDB4139522.1 branched-chain amino acid ABC transporter permease [Candidatus Thioglobus sp.]MDB9975063.1 branched-chain amino acid ABC transporter permease [Candidatus Thioglobus sp.]MDC1318689.1 branched-chain amino acid ABC transporter permease [Candidatus Thioglobus sp.]